MICIKIVLIICWLWLCVSCYDS